MSHGIVLHWPPPSKLGHSPYAGGCENANSAQHHTPCNIYEILIIYMRCNTQLIDEHEDSIYNVGM